MKKNPLQKLTFLIILLTAFAFAATGASFAATNMPDFSLKSAADGKTVSSKEFQGKILLITFWATWCPPCMQEIPSLIELQEEFGPKGFSVVAVSVDQGGSKPVKKIIDKTGINYPVLMADSNITRDFGGIVGIPTSFLINQEGHVTKSYPGYVPHSTLADDIKQMLE